MNKQSLIISIIAVILSFVGGFFLANSLNRNEISALQTEIGKLKTNQTNTPNSNQDQTLTDDEISQKISEADTKPDNVEFQKNLALALYRYVGMKQDYKWLPDVARLMTRVYQKNPKDFDTIAALGSIYFDLGASKSDNESFKTAREFYQKALEIKPQEIEIQTDLGLTYLLGNPSEPEKAITEFQKSLQINANHEKTLQNMIQAKTATGKIAEAESFLQKLKAINPTNEAISELSAKLEQAKIQK